MTINEKIELLRTQMLTHNIDTYIISKFDPHQSEYSEDYFGKSIEYISGFTGSAATVVITQNNAGLWTDGRYYTQASTQLEDTPIELFKASDIGIKSFLDYTFEKTKENGCIGFDGRTFSLNTLKPLLDKIPAKNIDLKTSLDLLDTLWQDRPSLSKNPVRIQKLRYSGESRQQKLLRLRNKMCQENIDAYIITSLDDIAWLLNARGKDLKFTPLFAAYLVIEKDKVILFIDKDKTCSVEKEFNQDGINICSYDKINKYLLEIPNKNLIGVNFSKLNYNLYKSIENHKVKEVLIDFTSDFKSIKNVTEINNLIQANIKYGVALVKFIKWLKEYIKTNNITEFEAENKLEEFRCEDDDYLEPSFDTICGYLENGAIIHYKALKETSLCIEPEGILLLDSGGHYNCGTTDVTRTFSLGPVSEDIKRSFTLVLKGHIALAKAIFIEGTTGCNLDVLARMPLWEEGLNYNHGTGHGIGFNLSVHEGPQNISQKLIPIELKPGMVISNEPGVYLEGQYGIRIENTLLVKEHSKTSFGNFFNFETISFCPIDPNCIELSLLTNDELDWLSNYHNKVYQKLSPSLNSDDKLWLANEISIYKIHRNITP